jgi:hypothetical protein
VAWLQVSGRPALDWLFDLAQPLWASLIEVPVGIDKTMKQPLVAGDDFVYWPN